jgi:hypothetical protein
MGPRSSILHAAPGPDSSRRSPQNGEHPPLVVTLSPWVHWVLKVPRALKKVSASLRVTENPLGFGDVVLEFVTKTAASPPETSRNTAKLTRRPLSGIRRRHPGEDGLGRSLVGASSPVPGGGDGPSFNGAAHFGQYSQLGATGVPHRGQWLMALPIPNSPPATSHLCWSTTRVTVSRPVGGEMARTNLPSGASRRNTV